MNLANKKNFGTNNFGTTASYYSIVDFKPNQSQALIEELCRGLAKVIEIEIDFPRDHTIFEDSRILGFYFVLTHSLPAI